MLAPQLNQRLTFLLLFLTAIAVPAGAQFVDQGTWLYTTDNVGINANATNVPLFLAKDGVNLAGNGFYNFRIGNAASSKGFMLGYDDSGNIGMIAACCANGSLAFWTHNGLWQERMRMDQNGNLGIGTTTPTAKLDIVGNVNVSGNIAAKYQDIAEWVPATHDMVPGTVVVLDRTTDNQVTPSLTRYDTAVAGVVSRQPGLILGEQAAGAEQVATTGRVKVRVDASRAPIRIGDLLVTSDKPGLAMRSMPISVGGVEVHRPGTIIGKALESLEKGEGEILVLLSLQ